MIHTFVEWEARWREYYVTACSPHVVLLRGPRCFRKNNVPCKITTLNYTPFIIHTIKTSFDFRHFIILLQKSQLYSLVLLCILLQTLVTTFWGTPHVREHNKSIWQITIKTWKRTTGYCLVHNVYQNISGSLCHCCRFFQAWYSLYRWHAPTRGFCSTIRSASYHWCSLLHRTWSAESYNQILLFNRILWQCKVNYGLCASHILH